MVAIDNSARPNTLSMVSETSSTTNLATCVGADAPGGGAAWMPALMSCFAAPAAKQKPSATATGWIERRLAGSGR